MPRRSESKGKGKKKNPKNLPPSTVSRTAGRTSRAKMNSFFMFSLITGHFQSQTFKAATISELCLCSDGMMDWNGRTLEENDQPSSSIHAKKPTWTAAVEENVSSRGSKMTTWLTDCADEGSTYEHIRHGVIVVIEEVIT